MVWQLLVAVKVNTVVSVLYTEFWVFPQFASDGNALSSVLPFLSVIIGFFSLSQNEKKWCLTKNYYDMVIED